MGHPSYDPHSVLARLLPERLQRLQRSSGLPVVFGGSVHAGVGGGPRLVIERLSGTLGQSLRELIVYTGRGMGGAVLRDATPIRAENYADADGFTHHYDRIVVDEERLTSVVAVPVLFQGSVQAVLYGAARTGDVGDRALRSAVAVAAHLQRDVEAAASGRLVPPLAYKQPSRPAAAALNDLSALIRETNDPSMRDRLSKILAGIVTPQLVRPPADVSNLTPREVEVLRIVHQGASNIEVAAELGLSPETVKAYLRTAMRRLDASSRMIAARKADQWGLL